MNQFGVFGPNFVRPSAHMSDDEREETDSECEYEALSAPACENLTPETVASTMRRQAGLCRLTGIPFGAETDPLYRPAVVQRVFAHEIDVDNHVIVLGAVKDMREATGLPWRPFVQLMQVLAREIEL